MADQAVSNERRKELEQLDPFQENFLKAIALAKEYKKQLILAASAVVLVVAVFSGIMYSFEKAENSAASLVSQTLSVYAAANDPEKGFDQVKDDFQKVLTEYANTTAGRQAKVKFAKICYDASKFDLSYQHYEDAYEVFKNEAMMGNFILSSLGHVSIAKKEYNAAKKYFLQIEQGESDVLKDEARYTLAKLYEIESNLEESRKMYEKIISQSQASMYNPIAESKIATMK